MVVSNSCSSQHQACDSRGRFCFRHHDFLQPTAPSLSCPSATPIPAWCAMGKLCLCCTSREHAGSRGPEIPSDIPPRPACPPPIPPDIPPMPARPPPIPPNIPPMPARPPPIPPNMPPMPTRPPPIPDTPTPEPLHLFFRPAPGNLLPSDPTLVYDDLQDMYLPLVLGDNGLE